MAMRSFIGTTLTLFLTNATLIAQTIPREEKKQLEVDPKLDAILKAWEAKMQKVEKFKLDCSRTETIALTGKSKNYSGKACYLKPNFASLQLVHEDKSDEELMVRNENKLYEYSVPNKLIKVHDLPQGERGEGPSFLHLLFGSKPEEMRNRYELQLKRATEGKGFVYVTIRPRTPADKQDFEEAELAFYSEEIGTLSKKPELNDWAFLPARLWIKQPNKNHVTWLFQNYDLKANLAKESFTPLKPKDWRIEVVDLTKPSKEKPLSKKKK
jgi:TIGR03009 family protein